MKFFEQASKEHIFPIPTVVGGGQQLVECVKLGDSLVEISDAIREDRTTAEEVTMYLKGVRRQWPRAKAKS